MVTEGLKDDYVKPRHMMFFMETFKEWTGLSIDDLYREKLTEEEHEVKVLKKQVDYYLERLNGALAAQGASSDSYVVTPPLYPEKPAAKSSKKYIEEDWHSHSKYYYEHFDRS